MSLTSGSAKSTPVDSLAFALAIGAFWFALHPYHGIFHDGTLYTFQALHALYPERYSTDLFFQFGSQDSFTIFSWLYRPLVATLGIGPAHYLATLSGEAAWLCSLCFLARAVFPDRREALFALIAAMTARSAYGGLQIFHYDEAFASPRPFAEALVMAAFTLSLSGRLLHGCFALVIAAAIHPIMALSGAAALGFWAAINDRRFFLLAGAAVGASVLLGALRVQPFARLFELFDPAWFEVVRRRCGLAILTRWTLLDYLGVVVSLAIPAAVFLWKDRELRRLVLACSLASLLGVGIALIGGDLARDVFVVNIQPWRSLWISRVLANLFLGVLALRAPSGGFSRPLLVIAIGVSALTRLSLSMPVVAELETIGAVIFFWIEERSPQPIQPWIGRAFVALFAVAALGGSALHAVARFLQPEFPADLLLVLLGAASLGLALVLDQRRWKGVGASVAAGVVFGATLLMSDQRPDWERYLEQPGASDDLVRFVGEDRKLYWDDNPELLWFKLGMPSYYSCLQGSGAMFYSDTALAYAQRGRALSRLNTHDFADTNERHCDHKAMPNADEPQSLDDIREACRALSDLDAIVLGVKMPGSSVEAWTSPAAKIYPRYPNPISIHTFYKYKCRDLR